MERLPVELLDIVFDYCDFRAVKNVRLTCKPLNDPAAAHIFRNVHMGLFKEGLDKLIKIAEHPVLNPLVKSFTFHGQLLPYYSSRRDWEARIDLRTPLSEFLAEREKVRVRLEGKPLSKEQHEEMRQHAKSEYKGIAKHEKTSEELDHHFELYEHYRREQEDWRDDREGVRFHDAICKLVNLKEVAVDKGWPAGNQKPVWRSLWPKILQGPDNWRFKLARTESAAPEEIERQRMQAVRHLTYLLGAISIRHASSDVQPITSISAFTNGDAFWCQSHLASAGSNTGILDQRIMRMTDAFKHVTKLRLKVWFLASEDTESIARGFAAFARAATEVEDLSLEFAEENMLGFDDGEDLVNFLPMVADMTWKKLTSLSLMLITTEDELVDLFKRHASTLRSLKLIDTTLRKMAGAWESVIRQLPQILKLEHVYLEALLDGTVDVGKECYFETQGNNDPYERAVKSYILYGGEMPILNRAEFYRAYGGDNSEDADGSQRSSEFEEDNGDAVDEENGDQ